MTYMKTGAAKRPKISPRKGVTDIRAAERRPIFRALLSPVELQRLVAAMID